MTPEDRDITNFEIILTIDASEKIRVKLTKEEKKVFISLLFNLFKGGFDTEPYLEIQKT